MKRLFVCVALTLVTIGCGTRTNEIAVAVEGEIYNKLVAIDDRGDRLAGCVTPADSPQTQGCKTFNTAILPALEAAKVYNRAVRNQDVKATGEVIRTLGALVNGIQDAIPTPAERDALIDEVKQLLASAILNLGR